MICQLSYVPSSLLHSTKLNVVGANSLVKGSLFVSPRCGVGAIKRWGRGKQVWHWDHQRNIRLLLLGGFAVMFPPLMLELPSEVEVNCGCLRCMTCPRVDMTISIQKPYDKSKFFSFNLSFQSKNPMTNGWMREGRGGIDSQFPLRGDLEE